MDQLLETIDDIKTLIPDSKYMTLMESLSVLNKQVPTLDNDTRCRIKDFVTFLLDASEEDFNVRSYINSVTIDDDLFYNVLVRVGGYDEQPDWLGLELNTKYTGVEFKVVDYLPKCSLKNYALYHKVAGRHQRGYEGVIELYFQFDSYDRNEFTDANGVGWEELCVENADSLGDSCLVQLAKTLVEKYL